MPPCGYRQRHPRESLLYQILEAHLESFEAVYQEQFADRYGRLRRCVMPVFRHDRFQPGRVRRSWKCDQNFGDRA